MKVEKIVVGELQENCYLVINNKNVLIIDPGDEFERIDSVIENNKLIPVGILITHCHFDHVGALKQFVEKYNLDVCDYKNRILFNLFDFEVIDTPGHTVDSVTYYFKKDNLMFTGDFIFKNSIGRTDLQGGNYKEMLESIEKIRKYNNNIIIYPGHGPNTNLLYEIENNIYFN